MNPAIEIKLSGDAPAYLKSLADPNQVLPALIRTQDGETQVTVGYIQRTNMSLPADGPTSPVALRVISNRLRGSLSASRTVSGADGLRSAIGSNVVYAGILEEGGTTKPHVIRPVNGKALAFGGRFFKKVNHPGSKIGGRHYVRRGVTDRLPAISAAFSKTIFGLKPS